jgi:hypothetical protein
MVSFLDYFLPNSTTLTPDQQSAASTQGLIGAGGALANLSAPRAGPAVTPLQLLAGGLQGYTQGTNDYVKTIPNVATAQLANSTAQLGLSQNQIRQMLANQYLTPGQQPAQQPAQIDPVTGQPMGNPSAPAMGASPSLTSFYAPTKGKAGKLNTGGAMLTASGYTPAQQAAAYMSQAQMLDAMGSTNEAVKMRELAVSIDPTLNYSKAYSTSQGQLPADLTKIGASGNESRKTAGYEATLRPRDQTVMIDGKPYVIPSNDAAAAAGALPANLPIGASTLIPSGAVEGAKTKAQKSAEADIGQLQKLSDVTAKLPLLEADLNLYGEKLKNIDPALTGPIRGTAAYYTSPQIQALTSNARSVALQLKDVYNLGGNQGFTDADRNYLDSLIGGAKVDPIAAKETLSDIYTRISSQKETYRQASDYYTKKGTLNGFVANGGQVKFDRVTPSGTPYRIVE